MEDSPPDTELREHLGTVLNSYNKTTANQQHELIYEMWGFRTVHVTLDEFLKPVEHRQRIRLANAARDLDNKLERWSTGHTWQKYLALPEDVFAIETAADSNPEPTQNIEALRTALQKFDSVPRNPDFHKVAALPEFKATHELLREYVASLVQPPDDANVTEAVSSN